MKRERFWVGTAMIVVPLLFLLILLSPGVVLTRSGPVEGHVTFHGHPLEGASIVFVPEDPRAGAWGLGSLDKNGHYRIESIWTRKPASDGIRYRICLIPGSNGTTSRASHGGATKTVWSDDGPVPFLPPSASSGFPMALCDPATTRFAVVLGSDPTEVDITF
jgi:hypothetical protein